MLLGLAARAVGGAQHQAEDDQRERHEPQVAGDRLDLVLEQRTRGPRSGCVPMITYQPIRASSVAAQLRVGTATASRRR